MTTYEKLRIEVMGFCNPIISNWDEEEEEMTKTKFQLQYLYSQAVGASSACESYGILRDSGQYRECKILCRTLLERLAKSLYAGASDTNAIERVIHEITSEVSALKHLKNYNGEINSEAKISILEDDLNSFKSLIENENYQPYKKIHKIFEDSQVEHLYHGSYSKYCEYSHGTFLSGIRDTPLSKLDEYISLLSPTVCASTLHQVACTDDNCTIGDDAIVLIGKIGELFKKYFQKIYL